MIGLPARKTTCLPVEQCVVRLSVNDASVYLYRLSSVRGSLLLKTRQRLSVSIIYRKRCFSRARWSLEGPAFASDNLLMVYVILGLVLTV